MLNNGPLISRFKQVDIFKKCQENTFLPLSGKKAKNSTKNQRFFFLSRESQKQFSGYFQTYDSFYEL
jgi:hypothetical protein